MKILGVIFLLINIVLNQTMFMDIVSSQLQNNGIIDRQNNPQKSESNQQQIQDQNNQHCLSKRRNQCVRCQQGYQLTKNRQCKVQKVSLDFIPCQGRQNCGQSKKASPAKIASLVTTKAEEQTIQTLVDPFQVPDVDPSRDFSRTNNQQVNIDQADLLKTDGTYIYTISNNILNIIQAYPYQNVRLVSFIKLNTQPEALFIEGNNLALFGTRYQNGQGYIHVQIYDITNRALPSKTQQYKFQGSYFDGRKTRDGYVYLVGTLPIRPLITPWYDIGQGKVNIPYSSTFVYEQNYRQPIFVNVITFDLRFPNKFKTKMITVVTESVNNIYMTEGHIYLAYQQNIRGLDYTVIHKIFVWRNNIIPFCDARIRGSINNQFNLDEYSGNFLRVASTNKYGFFPSINIYCLDYFLHQMAKILSTFQTNSITSTRFDQRKLYIGTDNGPFIVVAFPSHYFPQILGTVPLDGFSRFIFPYKQNILLSYGRSSRDNAGLKIWFIDVSNVFYPKQIGFFQLNEKFAGSKAQFQHKAFLLSAKKNLIVFPLYVKRQNFNGVLYLTVIQNDNQSIGWKVNPRTINHFSQGDNFREMLVQRSLYIEDLLFTKSKCLLKIHSLLDFSINNSLNLECGKE